MSALLIDAFKLLSVKTITECAISRAGYCLGPPPKYRKKIKPSPRPIFVVKPKPGEGQAFRRIVHFQDKYTVQPLEVTNLGGRDPITGRVVAKGIGGGIKQKYHQIEWIRTGPETGPPKEEKVIQIMKCGCRTADIALVASGDEMKYILATEKMKAGDILKTSREVPRIPVRPKEGDCYPLGALPLGTLVHNIQLNLDGDYTITHAAGTCCIIKRHVGDKVVLQLPAKQEWAVDHRCIATVGRLSNIEHSSTPIGSAQRNRELGNRPRSGLWKRKEGRHGRKIRAIPPLKVIGLAPKDNKEFLRLTHPTIRL